MLRSAGRAALVAAAESGSLASADAELTKLDPILRVLGRRRVKLLAERARLVSAVLDPAHVLRLATLLAAGEPEAAYDDEIAVRAEFDALRSKLLPTKRRGPWLVATIATFLVAVIGLMVWYHERTKRFDPTQTDAGAALGHALPGYLVEVDRAARGGRGAGDLETARTRLLDERARRALGPEASERTLDLARTLADVARARGEGDDSADRCVSAAASLNKALLDARLPYFVDVDVVRTPERVEPWLYVFYVEKELVVKADGADERVVHLWRLDRLNLRQGFLGYTRSRTGAAIVLLDQLESELVLTVLPGLPPGERTELLDEESRDLSEEWQRGLGERAAAIVREHYARWNDPHVAEIGELLARRRALVERWKANVAGLGLQLREPERLIPEADYAGELALRIPRKELSEWNDLHDRLLEAEPQRAFLRARADRVASIQRHELQHRVDYRRGLVPVPEEIATMLGVDDVLGALPGSLPARVRDEYSAYLAELAGEESPALELLLLARWVFDKHHWGGTYSVTAFAVLTALGKELGLSATARSGSNRRQLAQLFLAITDRPAHEIREAARRVFEHAYGAKIPELVEVRAVDHDAWRK